MIFMRIDLTLRYLCLVKSRSIAKSLCDENAILINGKPAKSSSTVRPGDRVTIDFRGRVITFKLLDVPEKQLSKSASPTCYERTDEPRGETWNESS